VRTWPEKARGDEHAVAVDQIEISLECRAGEQVAALSSSTSGPPIGWSGAPVRGRRCKVIEDGWSEEGLLDVGLDVTLPSVDVPSCDRVEQPCWLDELAPR
jgi:hypothetical protein